jgi:1,4-dihydroxy-2-naphthoate octaprenyltransferase
VFSVVVACAVLIQAGTNLFNDAADGERGADGPDRLGPRRLTGAGLATAQQVRRAALACFAGAFLGGLYLVTVGGIPILAIGLASLAAGYAYSAGPHPLSHTPWGEAFVLLFFGLVAVAGSYFLQAATPPGPDVLLIGLALGCYAAAVLLVNNVRDLDSDRRTGRRTLAAHLGVERSCRLYALLVLAPVPMLAAALGAAEISFTWLGLPLGLWLAARFFNLPRGREMNSQLSRTAMSQVVVGLLLCAGLLI